MTRSISHANGMSLYAMRVQVQQEKEAIVEPSISFSAVNVLLGLWSSVR